MKKYTYTNGFTLIYQPSETTIKITSIYAFVKVGSIKETDENRGASHFIEHMCFKGTNKQPNLYDIANSYDKIGAPFNAFTEKDYTCFEIRCEDIHTEKSLKTFSDIMLNSTFRKKDVALETPVMMEEMIRSADEPSNQLDKMMNSLLYSGTPYQYPVDDIEYHMRDPPFQYQNILNFYHKQYQPQNMVLSITSNLSMGKIKRILENTYYTKHYPTYHTDPADSLVLYRQIQQNKNKNNNKNKNSGKKETTEISYRIESKKGINATYLSLSFRTCDHSSTDRFALHILSQIIGGYMSSRMFMLLREHNGLTYESSCSTDHILVGGDFTIYVVLDSGKLFRNGKKLGVLPLLIGMLKQLINRGITRKELMSAKGYLRGKMLLNKERNTHSAFYNGIQETLYPNEPAVPFSQIYETYYSGLTVRDINLVISRYFQQENFCVGILSSDPPDLHRVQKICEHI